MPELGGPLDLQGFEYVRDVPAGAGGLVSIPLDAAVMARSGIASRRLTDVRVIDPGNSQVPYLLEKRDEPQILETTVTRRELPSGVSPPHGRVTTYAVGLPYQKLPGASVVFTTQARVFKRSLSIATVTPAADRRPASLVTHASVNWVHADPSLAAPAVTLPLLRTEAGLPLGVQLVGRRGNDARLLRTARWLVKALGHGARARKAAVTAKLDGQRSRRGKSP